MLELIWLLLFIIFTLVIYLAILKDWNYFHLRNVPFIRGWPILGCTADIVFGNLARGDSMLKIYRTYPKEKIVGVYEFIRPVHLVRDLELVKRISIKDFDHFVNHATHFDESADMLLGKALFFLKNEKWRKIRTALSPAFTINKIRIMFQLITECSTGFVDHLKADGGKKCDMQKLFQKFAADIIATSAFGLKVNSLAEPSNDFFKACTILTAVDGWRSAKFALFSCFPGIMNFFRATYVDKNAAEYFQNIIDETIRYRESNKVIRPDMIHLLMEARKVNKDWDDDYIVPQCQQFVFAGTENMSIVMSFMSYELAVHPDIQNRLYDEILKTEESLNGSPITYDALNAMKYMDAVVSETLRRWPPIDIIDRLVNKPYTVEYDNKTIHFRPGDVVWIPVYGFHMDEKYFPDPHIFDPERFIERNRDKINMNAYMPFGMGPRLCIASRFAIMECKAIFYQMLLEFSFERCEEEPVKLKKSTSTLSGEQGIWLKLQPRK